MKSLPTPIRLFATITTLLLLGAMPLSAQYFTGEIPEAVTVIGYQVTMPDGEWFRSSAVVGGETKMRIKHEQLPYWLEFDLTVLDAEQGIVGLSVFRSSPIARESQADGMDDLLFESHPMAETSVGLTAATRLAITSDLELEIKVHSLQQLSAEEFVKRTGTRMVSKKKAGTCCVSCGTNKACGCSVCASCGSCCMTGCVCEECEA